MGAKPLRSCSQVDTNWIGFDKGRFRPPFGNRNDFGNYSAGCFKIHMMTKIPFIDVSRCTDCGSCLEICPEVFRKNGQTGLIEVHDTSGCSEEKIQEAINICPADCILWDES